MLKGMINGTVDIKAFLILDRIKEKHGLFDKDWARESGLAHGARISELRAMAEGTREVADRAFNYKKFASLIHALQRLIGGEIVRKELGELLAMATDNDEKLILLITTLSEDRKEQAIAYLELLNSVPEKKQN